MRILITGATGLIGSQLTRALLQAEYQITVITRSISAAQEQLGHAIDYYADIDDLPFNQQFDAIINLAGEPIFGKRWTPRQKQAISQSRLHITAKLVEFIRKSEAPPRILLSGSAVGYYGMQGERIVTEESASTQGFTHQLCQLWEETARQATTLGVRVCLLRTGLVLSTHGGMLGKMTPVFRAGLGAILGDGRQFMPWIHIDDQIAAIRYLLEHPVLSGPFNLTAPIPVTNRQFSQTLAKTLQRPCFLSLPAPLIKLGLGEASALLLEGQRAVPTRLEEAGFGFQFSTLESALASLFTHRE